MKFYQTVAATLLVYFNVAQADIAVQKVTTLATDPLAESWQAIPAQDVQLMAQQVTMPSLAKASVPKLAVQGMTDGKMVAFRVSWQDATADYNVETGRFSDAVAIELPLGKNPSPMMGHKGGKVQILYWKGLWQKDQDAGFQDVQDLYPNYWVDLYWFAEGQPPYRVPDSFKNTVSHQWFVAKQAGNPMSVWSRTAPVQETVAESWGSLTHQPETVTQGKGVWKDGKWHVVFLRPLKTDDQNDFQFTEAKGQMAFAVWEGSDGNVGGRKHWSNWTAYQLP
jgi:hypothetical protein